MHCLLPYGSYIGEVFIKKIPSEKAAVFSSPKSQSCDELFCGTQQLCSHEALHSSVTFSFKNKELVEFFVKTHHFGL